MTHVLMIESILFAPSHKIKDNKLIVTHEVSEGQSHQDNCIVIALQKEIKERLEKECNAMVTYLSINEEPRSTRCLFEGKTDSLFVSDSISVHHFISPEGKITRRVIILYPMTQSRRGDLPKFQLIKKITKTVQKQAQTPKLELLDFTYYEAEGKVLEGLGALNFSYDGRFVYMALSARSNEEVLAAICHPENLDIPEENRFVFKASIPHTSKNNGKNVGEGDICLTSLIGWCGKGICAWGFEFMEFPSEEKQEAFYHHLEVTYKKIINLNADEIRAFSGNAREVAFRNGDDEHRVLLISESAFKTLQHRNLKIIEEWYGRKNIFVFYADVVQRRAGRSIHSLISTPVIHGDILPIPGQESALEVARVHEKEVPTLLLRR